MIRDITIGQHFPGNSLVHRFDPRMKLVLTVAYIAVLFAASNPLGLAEFTLSRKDPEYVGRAKKVQAAQKALEAGQSPEEALPELKDVLDTIRASYPEVTDRNMGVGSTIFAVKPGDGSAREQAASCQKVLGGFANICYEFATKRYRSNCINWGILPFTLDANTEFPYEEGDYVFVPNIREKIAGGDEVFPAKVIKADMTVSDITLNVKGLTEDEKEIILDGCLINYYASHRG